MWVQGAMQTPDGEWRVEVVRYMGDRTRWYRLVHGDETWERLTIAAVTRTLAERGVDMATLVDVPSRR